MSALEVAKRYFALSNKSDFAAIGRMLTDATTYSSQNTGTYVGKQNILNMQRAFHGTFVSLHWRINSVVELKPGVILFDYDFTGEAADGHKAKSSGLEYVTVYQNKIRHIEIRSKS